MATDYDINTLFKRVRQNIGDKLDVSIPEPVLEKPKGNDIGKQIAYYRKLKGWTQKELAEKVKVSTSCIMSYENKPIRLVNVDFLNKVFEVLEIEDKVKLPEYEKFILKGQAEKMQELLQKNNLNCYQFAKKVNIDDSNIKMGTRESYYE